MTQLKGGFTTDNPRCDAIPHVHTDRMLAAPRKQDIRGFRNFSWFPLVKLNQGVEGGCCAFGGCTNLSGCKHPITGLTDEIAHYLYWMTQEIDPWPGGVYPGAEPRYDGTSAISFADLLVSLDLIESYTISNDLNELIIMAGYDNPVELAIPWYEGMESVDEDGYMRVSGRLRGRHSITVTTVNIEENKGFFALQNTWDLSLWGINGMGKLHFDDVDTLLRQESIGIVYHGVKGGPFPIEKLKKW